MNEQEYLKIKEETYNKVTIHELINFDKKPENPVKVSIVIPVCNVESFLRECLDSAVNQTLEDIEIICINDGSKDNSLEIIKEYAAQDSRVKVISKDNAGYGHTMNIGMDLAQGEYIGILESDDYADLHMYEDLYKIAVEHDVEFVKADFHRFVIDENGEKKLTRMNVGYGKYYNQVLNPSENGELFKLNMQTWTGIYKKSYLDKYCIRHNETPGASYQDNGFYFRTYCWATKIYLVNQPYYMYRFDNPNSSVHNKAKAYCIKDEFDLTYEYLQQFDEIPEKSIHLFYWKKFKSYMFTLGRIGQELKKDFLMNFSEEFKKVREEDGLREELFSKPDWRVLNWIIDEPEDYYEWRVEFPKVSVLIPAYNVASYVRQCLDSILSQTLDRFEVICIDDGSTDKTLSILREYEAKYKNVIVYNQGNIGVGKTRNKAIDYAKGEFVIFMDPDDWYPVNDILETLYNAAKENNVKVCGGSFSDYVGGKIITEYLGTLTGYTFTEDRIMTYEEYQFDFGFHRFVYDREMLVENRIYFPEYVRFQDPPFFIKAMICAEKFYAMKKVVYCYRRPSANKVQWNLKKTTDLMTALKDDLEMSSKHGLAKLHALTLKRIDIRFHEPILKNAVKKESVIFELLSQMSEAIDHELLQTIDEDVSPYYIYDILVQKSSKKNSDLLVEAENSKKKIDALTKEKEQLKKKSEGQQVVVRWDNSPKMVDWKAIDEILELKNQILELKNQEVQLRMELVETRNSFSCKLGLFITFIPRAIKRLFVKQNK